MRISFDLDGTLICYAPSVPREPSRVPWWWKLLAPHCDEPLRKGAPALLRELEAHGHELWVYTTSLRPEREVRRWLGFYGVSIAHVVNQARHEREARPVSRENLSKFPPAFGIALHVDDEEGLAEAGARLGFRVLVVSMQDDEWAAKVRTAVWSLGRELLGGVPDA